MLIENQILYSLLIALLFVSSLTDSTRGKIPNSILLFSVVLSLSIRMSFGGFESLALGLFGGLLGLLMFYPLWWTGILGGGDVKFLVAIGSLLGPQLCSEVAVTSLLVGAVMGLVVLLGKRSLEPFMRNLVFRNWRGLGKTKTAFAPVMAISVILSLVGGIF